LAGAAAAPDEELEDTEAHPPRASAASIAAPRAAGVRFIL
jgi:hypothetical protein